VKNNLISAENTASNRNLNNLITSKGLKRHLEGFLLANRCEDLSPRTIADYSQKVGQVVDYLISMGVNEPSDVTATHLRGFLLAKQATVAPASVHSYYRCMKRFFNWLVGESILMVSPVRSIRAPKVPKKVIRPYHPDELKDFLLACEDRGILTLRDRAMILIFADTGIRLSEMAGIVKADIDVQRMTIKVLGKGRKERIVGIDRRTLAAIVKYVQHRTDDCPSLIVTSTGKPLTSNGIYQVIRDIGKRAELKETRNSPHTFRHTFATLSIKNGASLFDVQNVLGHQTLTMTRKYAASIDSENAAENHRKFSPVANMKL